MHSISVTSVTALVTLLASLTAYGASSGSNSGPITQYTCSGSTIHIGASMDSVTQACGYPDRTTQQADTAPAGKPVELWVYNAPSSLNVYGPTSTSRAAYNVSSKSLGPNNGITNLDMPAGKNPPPLIADNTFRPPMILEISDGKIAGIPGEVNPKSCQGWSPKVGDPVSKLQSLCGQPDSQSPERRRMNQQVRKTVYVWTYDQINNETLRLQFAQGQLNSIQVEK